MTTSRRTFLTAAGAFGAGLALTTSTAAAARPAPSLVRSGTARLPLGVMSGDVTQRSAVVWAAADRPGRLLVELVPASRRGRVRRLRGPVVDGASGLTGSLRLTGLRAGEHYRYRMAVDSGDGPGEVLEGSFTTAPDDARDVSFVWSGDTAGQGWGRNPDIGGMPGYAAMLAVQPDFFVHSGDTTYADGPIAPSVVLPDGRTYRNEVSDGVEVVAQTLEQFRGRHRYNLRDGAVRALNAEVPVYAQWDDHEVTNNWYPGEVLDDPRYDVERRVDVLAARGAQAFAEHFPLDTRSRDREGKVYGRFDRGPSLELFQLDMRSYRAANTANSEPGGTPFLGREQADWLVRSLARSRATWKVVLADIPLGLVVPDGSLAQEGVANSDGGSPLGREVEIASVLRRVRRAGVRDVVWLTADVHYCAAHLYDPARAAFDAFDPCWEFVAGPVHAGGFGPNALDGTFGPEVRYARAAARPNQSPLEGGQSFGRVAVDGGTGAMTVELHDVATGVLHTEVLRPSA